MKSYFLLAVISLLFTSQAYAIDPEQMQKLTQVFSDVGRINKALEIESKKRTGEIRGPGKENFVGEKIDTGECTTEFKNNGSVEAGDSKFILFDFLISGAACPFRIQINVVGEQVSEGAIKVAYSMKSDFPNQDMQTDAKFRSINMIGDIGVKVENKGNEIVQSFDVSIEMSGEHIEEGHLSLRNTFKGDIKIILPFGLGGQLGEEIKASLPGIQTVLKSNVDFASQSETYTQDDRNITKQEYEEIRKSLQLPFDPGEKEDGTLECDIKFWRAEQVSMSQLQQAIDQGQEILVAPLAQEHILQEDKMYNYMLDTNFLFMSVTNNNQGFLQFDFHMGPKDYPSVFVESTEGDDLARQLDQYTMRLTCSQPE